MGKQIILYHGSNHIISHPNPQKGNKNNDYGQGFYCTEHFTLACEWAAKSSPANGYINKYSLDLSGLNILDLSAPPYNILNWITILIQNRTFTSTSPISVQAKEYLCMHFNIDLSPYDVIIGYRADDSYFSFAKDFINNTISVQQLASAMKLGKLGIQYMLRTEKAFAQLTHIESQAIDIAAYHAKYLTRDLKARTAYNKTRQNLVLDPNELYILDIIRGGVKNEDPRL